MSPLPFVFFLLTGPQEFEPADLVLLGDVFTVDDERPRAEALAVRGEKIVFVGARAEAARWVGPETRTLDAGAGTILPGFNDAHCHFTVGYGLLSRLDLFSARGLEEILARVEAYVDAHPDEEVIQGTGWDLADMPGHSFPQAAWLDEIVGDRAVLLWSEGPHAVWASSYAMERAKLDGATNFRSGLIVPRDEDGEPVGTFLGRGLFGLFPFTPLPDLERMQAGIREGLEEAARLGVTSVHESVSPIVLPFLTELLDAGELSVRFHVWGGLTRSPFGGGVGAALELRKSHEREDWITFGTLKGGVDGMPSLRTADMLEPYADAPDVHGLGINVQERLDASVRAAHQAGLRVALHATGDAGVRAAVASIRASEHEGLRDRVEHAFLVDPADIPHLVASGTVVSVQPSFLARDLDQGDVYERRFGDERCKNVLPLRALVDAGVTLAFGTDFALNPLDPRLGLRAAVTRRGHAGSPAEGWHAEQRLTLEEALRAYTLGSAIAEGAQERKGTLTVGKLADVVVFERDLFEVDPSELPEVEIVATIVGGRVVHER